MILVTGGTGLVGSYLLYKLTQSESKVRAIYRSKTKIEKTKHVFSYFSDDVESQFSKIEWVEAHLNNIPLLEEAFIDIEYVYHCAAFISFDEKDYHELRQTNIFGTANIVNLCISNNIKKLCYVSSIATIGHNDNGNLITEETHWNPEEDHNVYAITKYGAEMEIWRGTQEGIDAVVVNPGIILGGGFWHSGSGSLFKRVYKGLSHYTTGVTGYIDVMDVVNSMVLLMNKPIKNERYIIVSESLSFKDFTVKTANALNVKAPTKEASKNLLQIAWRLDWLRQKLTGKRRRLTKKMTETVSRKSYYSNKKLVDTLELQLKPIDVSIHETSQQLLEVYS